jgi:hypothetical protein
MELVHLQIRGFKLNSGTLIVHLNSFQLTLVDQFCEQQRIFFDFEVHIERGGLSRVGLYLFAVKEFIQVVIIFLFLLAIAHHPANPALILTLRLLFLLLLLQ